MNRIAEVSRDDGRSQKVLIDAFKVPSASTKKFAETVRSIQGFIRTLPGYVEGTMYTKAAGESKIQLITTAVWSDQKSLENAKKMVPAEMQKRGFNPKETMSSLGVTVERGIYESDVY